MTRTTGEPLRDVFVFGGLFWYNLPQRKAITTGANGGFVLPKQTGIRVGERDFPQKNFGHVLHFRRLDLKPLTVVLRSAAKLHVVMQDSAATEWRIPLCQPDDENSRIGEHFRFRVPKTAKVVKSQDVDYVVLSVKGPSGASWLELWLGPSAGTMDADEQLFMSAVSFDERFVVIPQLCHAGIDARGNRKDGKRWRWVGLDDAVLFNATFPPENFWTNAGANHMIRYKDASERDAKFYDEIIDSGCVQPPTSRSR